MASRSGWTSCAITAVWKPNVCSWYGKSSRPLNVVVLPKWNHRFEPICWSTGAGTASAFFAKTRSTSRSSASRCFAFGIAANGGRAFGSPVWSRLMYAPPMYLTAGATARAYSPINDPYALVTSYGLELSVST